VLGAVIAPTDALAATSIAKRIGLRKQIVDILEGERLVTMRAACWPWSSASPWSSTIGSPPFQEGCCGWLI
jgi:hypothetical protein